MVFQTKSKSNRLSNSLHQDWSELRFWTSEHRWFHPLICDSVSSFSRLIVGHLNQVTFKGKERWDELFEPYGGRFKRTRTQGLLSFSNHVSLFDDPLLISTLGVIKYRQARWIAADHINFFNNRFKGLIYSGGKCVPIIRGGGLEQPGFDFLIDRLKQGDWVHIFPEGRRSRKQDHSLHLPLKTGIGKLIEKATPMVIPFYHYGMQNVMPIGSTLPKLKQELTVQFGHATTIDQGWWSSKVTPETSTQEAWQIATLWARDQLLNLERQVHPHKKEQASTENMTV